MASFFEKLWESIFTPGPTPTLLIATNASFAVLQVLLWGLLYVTYSIHFLMLALLSGGLWWAINWFAAEILEAQRAEEEAKRLREVKKQKDQSKGKGAASDGEAMDTGDDTEVDTEVESKRKPKLRHNPPRAARPETQSTVFVEKPVETTARESTPQASSRTGVSATGRLAPTDEALKKRKSLGESTGELSTDSEWEKLSEDSGEK